MKKLFLSILLLALATTTLLAQQRADSLKNTNKKDLSQYYMIKSRDQKASAYIFLSGGLVSPSRQSGH